MAGAVESEWESGGCCWRVTCAVVRSLGFRRRGWSAGVGTISRRMGELGDPAARRYLRSDGIGGREGRFAGRPPPIGGRNDGGRDG